MHASSPPPPSLAEEKIRAWLTDLSTSSIGEICLANMFLSVRSGIVTRPQLRDFLRMCLSHSHSVPQHTFEEVCRYEDGTGVLFFALSPVKNAIIRPDRPLSSTIKSDNFHRYLLSRAYKSSPAGIALTILHQSPQTHDEEKEFINTLSSLIIAGNWFDSSTTLGKPLPAPSYCWFTSSEALQDTLSAAPSTDSKATNARDVLGLIDSKAGECRLEIQFLAGSLGAINGLVVARPSFADRGNSRFAALQHCRKSALHHSRAWGTTVDLRKIADGSPEIAGLPERVCSALPIARLQNLRVNYLGRVSGTRGAVSGVDDDAAFAGRLKGALSTSQIIDALTREATS